MNICDNDNDKRNGRKSVRFDLATGVISAEFTSLIVHACLLCLAAGVLHVRTERNIYPEIVGVCRVKKMWIKFVGRCKGRYDYDQRRHFRTSGWIK